MGEPMQTDIDEGLYSRQLYVLGHDAMRRMQVGVMAGGASARSSCSPSAHCAPPRACIAHGRHVLHVAGTDRVGRAAACPSTCCGGAVLFAARVRKPGEASQLFARSLSGLSVLCVLCPQASNVLLSGCNGVGIEIGACDMRLVLANPCFVLLPARTPL